MNWLAANPLAVAAMWAGGAALAVWLYMHTRQPQRRRVATLRFWNSVQPVSQPRRLRIREPWALVAQLLFLLLLAIALVNPHWGATAEGRSVVVVLDTSIWSQARVRGQSPWIDGVHDEAQRVVNALPPGDQVLLMSADADVPSIMPFTSDKAALQRAIFETRASGSIADLPRSLRTGRDALAGSNRGLLVYVGPGMLDEPQARELDAFREQLETGGGAAGRTQFLVRLVGGNAPVQNWGITRLALRRDATQPDRWHLLTQVKNYTGAQAQVALKLSVNGHSFVQRAMTLVPNELVDVENQFVWDHGGLLQADISPTDALDSDNHAVIAIPTFRPVQVALFTTDPAFAKNVSTVLSSNPYLKTETVSSGSTPKSTPDVAVYQGMNLPEQPGVDSIWFLSGSLPGSPLLRVTDWNSQHPAARWVRSRDVTVRNPARLRVLPGDTVLATAGGNPPVPLIVARQQSGHRLVIVGFDPHDSNFQLQAAFPLLMAGSIEWMTQPVDEVADSFSVGEVKLPGAVTRVISPSGKDVPLAHEGTGTRLLATENGVYRVVRPDGETDIGVNTPLLPAERLTPTAFETAAPLPEPPLEVRLTLWRWLIVLAAAALFLEWWLYYSSTRKRQLAENRARSGGTGTEIQNSYAGLAGGQSGAGSSSLLH